MTSPKYSGSPVHLRTILELWWPLAASWLLMGCELPLVSAFMARLPSPTVSLAAYGGIVFPLSMLIESPIIMLLSASTAMSRDWQAYRQGRRFMLLAGGGLSLVHALVAFTPLYYIVVGRLLAPPAEILEPARLGMQIMTPWTLSIAYRRFQQGVLIRAGKSRTIGIGTAVRMVSNAAVLVAGYFYGRLPGIAVGTLAVAVGVGCEALYAGWVVRPVLRGELRRAPAAEHPLTMRGFLHFYIPLALSPLIMLASMPLATAAISRMPRALESLAAWPVVNGLIFTLRSVGFALHEVVVSLMERPMAARELRRFSRWLAVFTSLLLLLLALTPLAGWWLRSVAALPPNLAALARVGLVLSFLMPAFSALQSYPQGVLVYARRTRAITESVVAYLVFAALVLVAGVFVGRFPGLYAALLAFVAGSAAQYYWLWHKAKVPLKEYHARDAARHESLRYTTGFVDSP